jgi:hypothetical protein
MGELLDGYDALYHGSFFKRVSPQLESLSLFSCHSEDAAEFYDLSNLLTHQTSFHPERLLFTVKPNHIYDKKNIAPISLLGGFIKSIDHTLHAQLHSQRPSQKARQAKALPPTPLCTLELNHVALTTGSISVLINQHIVGVLHPASPQDDAVFSFPCNLLHSLRADSLGGEGPRGEPNSLVLLNSMHQDRSVLKTISRIQAKIQTPFGFAYSPKFEAPLLSEAEDFKKMIAFF